MILYPPLASALGLDEAASGVLFGATIHDVAQVRRSMIFDTTAAHRSAAIMLCGHVSVARSC
jgi:uncharacterized membrane protein YadS